MKLSYLSLLGSIVLVSSHRHHHTHPLSQELVGFVNEDDETFNESLSKQLKLDQIGDHGFADDDSKYVEIKKPVPGPPKPVVKELTVKERLDQIVDENRRLVE